MLALIKRLVLTKQEYSIITEHSKWLKETEIRMDHLINKTNEIVCTFAEDGRLLFGNKAFQKNSQYSKEDFSSLSVDNLLSEGSKVNVYVNLKRLAEGESISDIVCKFYRKDRTIVYVRGNVIPVFEDGNFKGSQAFFRNINDQVEANKHRIEYIEMLEELLFTLSHKVRKPVATCLGLIEVVQTEEALTDADIKEYIGYLTTSVHELDVYIREMSGLLHARRSKIASTEILGKTESQCINPNMVA